MLPAWGLTALLFSGFVFLTGFLVCGTTLEATDTNAFTFLGDLITGDAGSSCGAGLPDWFDWALFVMVVAPLVMLLWTLISPFFNNAVTGTVLGVVTGVVVVIALVF